MSAHTASHRDKNPPHLRLVHSHPAPWIANATLADTRAYVESMREAWQALAALSVPDHALTPAAGRALTPAAGRQFSVTPQTLPVSARRRPSVGGAGLEIA